MNENELLRGPVGGGFKEVRAYNDKLRDASVEPVQLLRDLDSLKVERFRNITKIKRRLEDIGFGSDAGEEGLVSYAAIDVNGAGVTKEIIHLGRIALRKGDIISARIFLGKRVPYVELCGMIPFSSGDWYGKSVPEKERYVWIPRAQRTTERAYSILEIGVNPTSGLSEVLSSSIDETRVFH